MRRFFKTLFSLLISGLLACTFWQIWQHYETIQMTTARFNARPSLQKAKDGTSISPSVHRLSAYQKGLQTAYPFLYHAAYEVPMVSSIGRDVIIPGLISSKSYDFGKKKQTTATAMTPQGLTLAGPYLLITAYDGDYRHASVVYVIDRHSGRYLKSVQIAGRPHLGGIAYDPVAKNIWLTGSQAGSPVLMSFSLSRLKTYRNQNLPIHYNHVITLPTIERASTVTYYDDQLFVGFFNMYGHGKVASYPIVRNGAFSGSIISDRIKAITGQVEWSDGSGSTTMDRQIQGIAFYQNMIFLSQSYGHHDSKLYIFSMSALNDLDEKNAQKVVTTPPYLEQIYVENGQLLMLFESGSKCYAKPGLTVMDRVLSVNINALLGD